MRHFIVGLDGSAPSIEAIMVSGHGYRGFDRLLLGSVTTRLVHTARLPVLVVR